jgi:hypothetical protein
VARKVREVNEIFRNFRGMAPYPGFVVDLVEYPGNYTLRVYGPNVEQYSTRQKVELATHLYVIRDAIRALGVKCDVEGSPNDPPANRQG